MPCFMFDESNRLLYEQIDCIVYTSIILVITLTIKYTRNTLSVLLPTLDSTITVVYIGVVLVANKNVDNNLIKANTNTRFCVWFQLSTPHKVPERRSSFTRRRDGSQKPLGNRTSTVITTV